MGMPITLELVGPGDQKAAISAAYDRLRAIDDVFSTYKPDSIVSRINTGKLTRATAPAEVWRVLEACDQMTKRTDGFFNPVHNGVLDPSGYVKGWAIAEVAQLFIGRGFANFCVEAGGDISVGGHNEHLTPWRVGIRHPKQQGKLIKVLSLTDGAVATSGTYERGAHIYDPHTGQFATAMLSLSVVGPDIIEADVLATAAFAMGPDKALAFIASQGLEGYMVDEHDRAVYTQGFVRYVARD